MALDSLFLLLKNLVLFSSFVSEKSSFPKPLSKEKEREYVIAAEAGDREAKEILIKHNLRLVAHIAKKYANYGDNDELISVGSIGLIKAVESFRHDKGTQLATYASRCIENEILMYLRKNQSQRNEVSIDEPLNIDWDGNELLLSDILGTEPDSINRPIEDEAERDILLSAIHNLDKRERMIMEMRFGLEGREEKTQKEVADIIGISQSYISRLEKRIIKKLKKELEKRI